MWAKWASRPPLESFGEILEVRGKREKQGRKREGGNEKNREGRGKKKGGEMEKRRKRKEGHGKKKENRRWENCKREGGNLKWKGQGHENKQRPPFFFFFLLVTFWNNWNLFGVNQNGNFFFFLGGEGNFLTWPRPPLIAQLVTSLYNITDWPKDKTILFVSNFNLLQIVINFQ